MRLPVGPVLAIALLAGGCDKQPEERAQAAGEILPGTITDAMIATDQTRAQPPLAPRAPGGGDAGKPKAKAAAADEPEEEGEGEPAIGATPEASPAPAPAPAPVAT